MCLCLFMMEPPWVVIFQACPRDAKSDLELNFEGRPTLQGSWPNARIQVLKSERDH